ncbi:MAG TPA: hypothetical protein GX515_10110 [Firmicutes bacterium]|nr:hypothetical protein [Bacillota bacterium]
MNRYWENEKPIVAASGKNVLRWFPKAGRLQVSLPDWEDGEGRTRPGKTVTLDVEAMRESEDAETARAILADVLAALDLLH